MSEPAPAWAIRPGPAGPFRWLYISWISITIFFSKSRVPDLTISLWNEQIPRVARETGQMAMRLMNEILNV